mmetsp:Transcript_22883/g.63537  ORF Transcript_22883/g.63537 Transcript_22883/m.63537 type:complete len:125 (+) Transcript_22883:289-663(+)
MRPTPNRKLPGSAENHSLPTLIRQKGKSLCLLTVVLARSVASVNSVELRDGRVAILTAKRQALFSAAARKYLESHGTAKPEAFLQRNTVGSRTAVETEGIDGVDVFRSLFVLEIFSHRVFSSRD